MAAVIESKTLPSGRTVIDTGRVLIGLRAPVAVVRDPGVSAEIIQRAICAKPRRVWEPAQPVVQVSRPWWLRVVDALRKWIHP